MENQNKKVLYRCSICGFKMGWEDSDYEHGTMWGCERCGATFCTSCAVKRIGRKAYDEMIENGKHVLCPDCMKETASIDEKSEWKFLIDFVKDDTVYFHNEACRNQFMALWTSYCLHSNLDIDTAMYDAVLMDLFNALSDEQKAELRCPYFPDFDDMMGAWLA